MSGGFEEKLNSILNDRQAMGQIMALAQSLSGSEDSGRADRGPDGDDGYVPVDQPCPEQETQGLSLEGIDPALLSLGMNLLAEYNRKDERAEALLRALRPYLRPERWQRVDRAVSVARLSRVATALLRSFGGNGGGQDV